MSVGDTEIATRLALGIVIAFAVPIVCYLMTQAWSSFVNRVFGGSGRNPKIQKMAAIVCLLMPLTLLAVIAHEAFDDLEQLWRHSPFTYSITYFTFGVLIPIGLLVSVARVWSGRWPRL